MGGLGLMFRRRAIQAHPSAGSDYIRFADEEVFRVLMANGVSSDGIGITKEDAAAVSAIKRGWFENNALIKSFDELAYFVNAQIEAYAFNNCTSLQSIDFSNQRNIAQGTCYGCTSLTDVKGIGNALSLAQLAFLVTNISGLLHLANATYIGRLCFGGCLNLTKLILEKAETIDGDMSPGKGYYGAFGGCENIEEIVMPEIIKVGIYAFWHNYSAKKVHIGSKCTLINTAAFQGCNINDFIIETIAPPETKSNTFVQCTINNLYVPDAAVDAYKAAANWSTYASVIKPLSQYQG